MLSNDAIRALETSYQQADLDKIDQQLIDAYDEIVKKIHDHMPLFHSVKLDERLASARDNFAKLSAIQDPAEYHKQASNRKVTKIILLRNLIYALQAGPPSADMRPIGLVSGFGRVPATVRFHQGDELVLTSPSGLFKSRYILQ